ncbi:hypothetical protein GCM10009101_06850 [Brevundimonas lenta]
MVCGGASCGADSARAAAATLISPIILASVSAAAGADSPPYATVRHADESAGADARPNENGPPLRCSDGPVISSE